MDSPFTAVVFVLLALMVAAGAVMVVASRRPGNERLVRGGFLLVVTLFLGMLGSYTTGGFQGVGR